MTTLAATSQSVAATAPPLRTLHAAALTPFHDDETLNRDALARWVGHAESQGIGGIYAGGGSAELMMLTEVERIETFRVIRDAASPNTHLVAQVGAVSLGAAQRMADKAAALGFHALSSTLPHYHSFSFDELRRYFSDLTATTGLPMVIYYAPSISNVRLSFPQMTALMGIEHIDGLKYTDHDLFYLNGIRRSCPNAILFNGFDEVLLAGLVMGADAGIGTTYSVQGRRVLRVLDHARAGRLAEARAEQDKLADLVRVMVKHGVLPSTKYLLHLQGIDMGECRRPFAPVTEAGRSELRAYHESAAGLELLG